MSAYAAFLLSSPSAAMRAAHRFAASPAKYSARQPAAIFSASSAADLFFALFYSAAARKPSLPKCLQFPRRPTRGSMSGGTARSMNRRGLPSPQCFAVFSASNTICGEAVQETIASAPRKSAYLSAYGAHSASGTPAEKLWLRDVAVTRTPPETRFLSTEAPICPVAPTTSARFSPSLNRKTSFAAKVANEQA